MQSGRLQPEVSARIAFWEFLSYPAGLPGITNP
jgi:hypothetical protein